MLNLSLNELKETEKNRGIKTIKAYLKIEYWVLLLHPYQQEVKIMMLIQETEVKPPEKQEGEIVKLIKYLEI